METNKEIIDVKKRNSLKTAMLGIGTGVLALSQIYRVVADTVITTNTDIESDAMTVPEGRTTTIVVAASNSSAVAKEQADYFCDGVDDQVEIQAAINALPATGGTIVLTNGKFVMNPVTSVYVSTFRAAVIVNTDNNYVNIVGSHGTVIEFTEGNVVNIGDGIIMFYLDHCNQFSISHCVFDGKQLTQTATYISPIFSQNSTNFNIYKNVFINTNWAIWGDGFSDGGAIEDNVLNLDGAFGIGLHNNPNQCVVRNNCIDSPSAGIFVDSVSNCIIEGNIITNASYIGINLWDDNHDCIVANNVVKTGSGTGINIYTDNPSKPESDGIYVHGNLISNMKTGIRVRGSNIVRGNLMVACTTPIDKIGQGMIIEGNIPQDPAYITDLATRGTYINIPTNNGFSETKVGTGKVAQKPFELTVYTGTGTNVQNIAVAYCQAFGLCTASYSRNFTSFSIPHELIFNYTATCSDEAVVRRVQFKGSRAEGALSTRGIGIRVNNFTMIGESFGTKLGEVNLSKTLSDNKPVQVRIVHVPGVKIEWWVDGTLAGTQTDTAKIPMGLSDMIYFVHSIASGVPGSGTNAQAYVSAPKIWVGK